MLPTTGHFLSHERIFISWNNYFIIFFFEKNTPALVLFISILKYSLVDRVVEACLNRLTRVSNVEPFSYEDE